MSHILRSILLGACFLTIGAAGAAGEVEPGAGPDWRAGVAFALTRYTPSFSGLPRGTSEAVTTPGVEVTLGRRLSSRLWLHLSAMRAETEESEWESDPIGGSALLPTPGLWSVLATLRTPLYHGRVVPFAAVGAGFTRFDEVDDTVRFEWPSIEEDNRMEIAGRTDGTLVFDLGAGVPWTPRWETEISYRLLSVFSDNRVNTIDHLTLSGVVHF